MTRILLTLAFVFSISLMASAQFKKGDILLGGTLAYSHNNTAYLQNPSQRGDYGNFNISAGKALNEREVLGVNLNFTPYWTSEYSNYGLGPLGYSDNGYGISIFYRKYKALGKDFYLFAEAGAGYTGSTQTGKDSADKKVIRGYTNAGTIYLTPGFAYRVSNKVLLEITIPNIIYVNYSSQTINVQDVIPYEVKGNSFSISTSLSSNPLNSLGIGFRLIL